jgi:hypothetical protein
VAAIGRVGAGIERFQESAQPVFRGAQVGAAVSGGLVAAGVASLPVVSEQLTNSFALLTREIGISVIPGVVRMSGWFQSAARTFRSVNEHTGGMLGSGLFYGGLTLGGVGLANSGFNMAKGVAGNIGSVASWGSRALGFGAEAAGTAAAQAGGNIAGNVAGRAVGRATGRAAGSAVAGAGGSAVGSAATAAGGTVAGGSVVAGGAALASNPVGWAVAGLTAAALAAAAIGGVFGVNAGGQEINRRRGRPDESWMTNFGTGMLELERKLGIGDTATIAAWNPQGQSSNSFEALYDRILNEGISSAPGQAEQEGRAYQELVNALNRNSALLASSGGGSPMEAP